MWRRPRCLLLTAWRPRIHEAKVYKLNSHGQQDTPSGAPPRYLSLSLNIPNVKTTPHRCLPLVQSHRGVCKVRGGPGPPRAGPPTPSPMTVSPRQIRPRGTRFLTTTSRSETFASRRYFAPGGMARRPRTGRSPGSDARAVRGRRRRER